MLQCHLCICKYVHARNTISTVIMLKIVSDMGIRSHFAVCVIDYEVYLMLYIFKKSFSITFRAFVFLSIQLSVCIVQGGK